MKTTNRVFWAVISAVGLAVLWAVPFMAAEKVDAGRIAIEFCLLVVTYLMLVYPGLFSFMRRGKKQVVSRAMA
jgi:hypothetical protein